MEVPFKTGIKLKRWIIMVLAGGRGGYTYHWTSAEICVSPLYFLTFRVIPCWMKFCQSYLFNATSDIWIIITLDKERSENECLHQHCGPRRSKLARDSFAIILSRIVALLSIVLLIIVNHLWSLWRWFPKFTKTTEIKPTLVWRGGGRGVGDK